MRDVVRILLQILASSPALTAQAGTLYRCDDGGTATIYQTLPCTANQRTLEQREYVSAVPAPRSVDTDIATVAARTSRRDTGARSAAPHSAPRNTHEAFVCAQRGREWVQSKPCRSETASDGRKAASSQVPRQSSAARDEVCRRLRDGSDRGAADERPSDSAYRRNLLRDRSAC